MLELAYSMFGSKDLTGSYDLAMMYNDFLRDSLEIDKEEEKKK